MGFQRAYSKELDKALNHFGVVFPAACGGVVYWLIGTC